MPLRPPPRHPRAPRRRAPRHQSPHPRPRRPLPGGGCRRRRAESSPPPPPLVDIRDVDLKGLQRLLGDIAAHVTRERDRTAGRLTPASESVAKQRAFARRLDQILPHALAALDRSTAAALSPADLTALLAPVRTANEPDLNQSGGHLAEPGPTKRSTPPDSHGGPSEKVDSINRLTPAAGRGRPRSARTLRRGPAS